jgi:hypothetical protein
VFPQEFPFLSKAIIQAISVDLRTIQAPTMVLALTQTHSMKLVGERQIKVDTVVTLFGHCCF